MTRKDSWKFECRLTAYRLETIFPNLDSQACWGLRALESEGLSGQGLEVSDIGLGTGSTAACSNILDCNMKAWRGRGLNV